MVNLYENIVEEFINRNCKLLTTPEEHASILKCSKNYKFKYIASCGHEHIVFYNVFKSRGTGIVCPSCKSKQNTKKMLENMKNTSKISKIEQEFNVILTFKEILQSNFDFIKAFDGCHVDFIIKPKNVIKDEWIGVQVKTTLKRNGTYGFYINNIYIDCLILLHAINENITWLIPENTLQFQQKISIGIKSKYNIYKTSNNNIINRLNELYQTTTKFPFEILNTPINFYQIREQEFRKLREEKIPLQFIYQELEGTVYDFKIGDFKIQEKVSTNNNGKYIFCLYKRNGYMKYQNYSAGDNDFYWLNCNDKESFLVIPEYVLINEGYINCSSKKRFLKITINDNKLTSKNKRWLQAYMFNYNSLDENRLLSLFQ